MPFHALEGQLRAGRLGAAAMMQRRRQQQVQECSTMSEAVQFWDSGIKWANNSRLARWRDRSVPKTVVQRKGAVAIWV